MNKLQNQLLLHISKDDLLYTQQNLSDLCGISQQKASYHLRQLKKHRYISVDDLGRIRNYKLTQKGKNYVKNLCLTPSERQRDFRGLIDRAHDLRIRCKIRRKPSEWSNACEYKVVPMRNWNKHIRRMEGIVIEASNSSIIYRVDNIYDTNPQLALDTAFDLIERVNERLIEENPKLVLGDPECLAVVFYQHHGLPYDPFAVWCHKHNIQARFKDVRVDASKGVPELEFENNLESHEHAVNYLKYVRDIATGKIKREDLSRENIGRVGEKIDLTNEGIRDLIARDGDRRYQKIPYSSIHKLYRAVDRLTDYYARVEGAESG